MKFSTSVAIFFAASIALAVAYPPRYYESASSDESGEYEGRSLLPGRQYALSTAPFFYQARHLELEEKGKKYKVVKKKKNQVAPAPASEEDDEPQDEEEASSEEEEEEDEEQADFDTPSWDKMFPEEDKNTGTFDNSGGGYGQPFGGKYHKTGNIADLPGGAPAPESGGSLWNWFGSPGSGESSQNDFGSGSSSPPYQAVRARTSGNRQKSGGAVLYDGYQYFPVNPVHVRAPQRQSKKTKKSRRQESSQSRSLITPTSTQKNKNSKKPQYVLVPVERDSREVRFTRDRHGFQMENGPVFAPTEIWRWEGPGGRPLRRRDNRPSAPYFTRSHRGKPAIRFQEDSDY